MSNKNIKWAAAVVAGVALWMGTGLLTGHKKEAAPNSAEKVESLKSVTVRTLKAAPHERTVKLTGRTAAKDVVHVAAEMSAKVERLAVSKGQEVKKGQLLLVLDSGSLPQKLAAATAKAQEMKLQYQAAVQLAAEGFRSPSTVATKEAQWSQAKAEAAQVKRELAHVRLVSPVNGRVEERFAAAGDYVGTGQTVFDLLDTSEVKVVASAAQNQQMVLQKGQRAEITLSDGRTLEATLSFVGEKADEKTRTFPIEAVLKNPKDVSVGLTADVRVQTGEETAHFIPNSALVPADDGKVGIFGVDAKNIVQFYPVDLSEGTVEDGTEGFYINGLPETFRLVVQRQESLVEGETVSVGTEKK